MGVGVGYHHPLTHWPNSPVGARQWGNPAAVAYNIRGFPGLLYESPWLGSTCASFQVRFLGSAAAYPSMLQQVDCWVYHGTRSLDNI